MACSRNESLTDLTILVGTVKYLIVFLLQLWCTFNGHGTTDDIICLIDLSLAGSQVLSTG